MLDALGLSLAAKVAWVAVVFTIMFVFLPAVVSKSSPTKVPQKQLYKELMCYKDTLGNGNRVLICDYPYTPTGLGQTHIP